MFYSTNCSIFGKNTSILRIRVVMYYTWVQGVVEISTWQYQEPWQMLKNQSQLPLKQRKEKGLGIIFCNQS